MNDQSAIEVINVSKKYRYGSQQPYYSLRETLMGMIKHPVDSLKWYRPKGDGLADDEFWALRKISFSVKQGEVIGIIGRNGAGKSTLLKIISRITHPTEGEIHLSGRVTSLLEVGTGFHPELTGRENIYLNAAILGMRRSEIKRKMAQIIEFAEVEKFIDTPVKHYSSGMHTRLAFSVSAHLDFEILIIDEVLSVGDLWFQQKCLKKMDEVNSSGRTVLIVSHDMDTIQTLAHKILLLEDGKTRGLKPTGKGIQEYIYKMKQTKSFYFKAPSTRIDKTAYILEATVKNHRQEATSSLLTCDPIIIEIKWKNVKGVPVTPNFMLVNQNGVKVMLATDVTCDWDGSKKKEKGTYISSATVPPNLLNANDYFIHISLDCASPFKKNYDNCPDALRVSLRDPMDERSLARGAFTHVRKDVVFWSALTWNYKKIN